MTFVPETITAELMEHADGHPIGYVDATAVVVFVYQQSDGTHVIDICTRDDTTLDQLNLLVDGKPLPAASTGQR